MTKNRLENGHEGHVVDACAKGKVQRIAFPVAVTHVLGFRRGGATYRDIARAGEKIAEFVEGDRHHAVGGVEGFFDAVAVVDVDVDVENARVFSGKERWR